MSLEQAILDVWAGNDDLTALVPVQRVFTGLAVDRPARPYVVLHREPGTPQERTSSGTRIDRSPIRFQIWVDDLDQGKQIADAIDAALDRSSFDFSAGRVLIMRRLQVGQQIIEVGRWHVWIEYLAVTENATAGA